MYRLVYAGAGGRFFDHPDLLAAGRTGDRFVEMTAAEMIPLPPGASLVLIPGGSPVGLRRRGGFTLLERMPAAVPAAREMPGKERRHRNVVPEAGRPGRLPGTGGEPVFAVGALLPQGYTRTLLPAYRRPAGEKPLPLFGYAAVAWRQGRLWTAARRTDDPERWDPRHYNTPELSGLVARRLQDDPDNRILARLARCALEYSCFTAQNIFYRRWEGGVPVSPACNARCLGCISRQPAECCPSPQGRIDFKPDAAEVAALLTTHLERAPGAIISFGQGCEGEPSLAADTIAAAVEMARRRTARGTLNMNSNAGDIAAMEKIYAAGLDALRVSLISARADIYQAYHRPRGFTPDDVRRSIRAARRAGVFVSLNLLVMPGLTDRADELAALEELIRETGVQMVQLRNLNIDPDFLWPQLPAPAGEILGVPEMIRRLKKTPGLLVGSFSREVHQT
ncbi:radical SAM protein [Desulfotomaculum copahuensis]|uniref:Radical SAM protein n=1 Tax=Desulfotomaculum copahuensis TaxID=1838280 RepID=A0A1B7LB53_9FIRM|nr:radical SAM protein [Desulfotomaculum copahuensis]